MASPSQVPLPAAWTWLASTLFVELGLVLAAVTLSLTPDFASPIPILFYLFRGLLAASALFAPVLGVFGFVKIFRFLISSPTPVFSWHGILLLAVPGLALTWFVLSSFPSPVQSCNPGIYASPCYAILTYYLLTIFFGGPPAVLLLLGATSGAIQHLWRRHRQASKNS